MKWKTTISTNLMKITSFKIKASCASLWRLFNLFLVLPGILVVLSACDPGLVFEKNETVNANAWKPEEPVTIDFNIDDTISPVNLYVNIRHNTNYDKSNLYLFVSTLYPNQFTTVDTLEFILAEPDGKWIGSGFGKIRSLQIPIARGVRFPMSGEYQMRFEQAMRTDELAGIEDIGLRIEKMQDN